MRQSSQFRVRKPTRHCRVFLPLALILLLRCSRAAAFLATPTSTAVFRGEQRHEAFQPRFLAASNEHDADGSRSEATMETGALATDPPKEADTTTTNMAPQSVAPSPTIEQEKLRRQQQQPPPVRAQDIMLALNTSPRRLFLGAVSATGIALAGNFLGVTSQLLTLVPESTVESTGLDTYFPRGEYKRVNGKGYSFVIPAEWVGDTFVELAKAQRAAGSLDYGMRRGGGGSSTLPDSAFGPPGRLNPRTGVSEQGDTNVSVIVSGGLSGFSLKGTLGPPNEAAEKLIRLSLAPPGSGRTITLRSAVEETEQMNRQVYRLEYDVDRGERGPPLRAISVIAAGTPVGTKLITMTVTAPQNAWTSDATLATKLEKIAESFHTI